jgi:hypothetical protein
LSLSSPHAARAFYDPSAQRWIYRDPVAEIGFQSGRGVDQRAVPFIVQALMLLENPNCYTFVGNAPVSRNDPEGLQGCPMICFPVPCPPGSFGLCVELCRLRGRGLPIGPALCLLCFSSNTGTFFWLGCPCWGNLRDLVK